MISRIHDRLGTAGFVIAIVALVAALSGVAVAAGGLTKPQEKQVKKLISKEVKKHPGPEGKEGKQGPVGPAGAAGAPGKEGPQGKEGKQGIQGVPGEAGACSTSEPECVAPAGAIMTGDWSFVSPNNGSAHEFSFELSYPLRLSSNPVGVEWVQVTHPTAACPGIREAVTPGLLCVYMEDNAPASGNFYVQGESATTPAAPNFGQTQDQRSGYTAFLTERASGEAFALGSWAIKAP